MTNKQFFDQMQVIYIIWLTVYLTYDKMCIYTNVMPKATSKRGASRRSLQQAIRAMRVMAHPVRVRLLERLDRAAQPLSVTDLARYLGQPQYAVSQHLSRMYLQGLLRRRQRGREVFYTIADKQLVDLLQWIRRYQQRDNFWAVEGGEAI